jgi:hypothetical protein
MSPTDAAAAAYARGLRLILGLDGHTPEEAARAAWTPGGASISELVDRIAQRRLGHGFSHAEHRAAS